MKNILILSCLSIFIVSCNDNKQGAGDYIILDIEKELSTTNLKNSLILNSLIKEMKLIPVATGESCLFEDLFIAGTTQDHVVSYDKNAVYRIDKIDGKVKPIIKRVGRGPGEYKIIFDVVLKGDSIIYIYDNGKRGFLKYDMEGRFHDFSYNDSIGTFRIMPDGNICAITSPFYNNDFFTEVFDANWNPVRHGVINDRKAVEFDMYYMNDLRFYNQKILFRDYFGDTVYNVTTSRDIPYIVFYQGDYKMPIDVASDNLKRRNDGRNYIDGINYIIASQYCFLTYYFDDKQFFDIWDIIDSQLLYRNIGSLERHSYGIPLEINNHILSIWPNFAKDGVIYCVIQPEDAIKLISSLPEDTNPILIELTLR